MENKHLTVWLWLAALAMGVAVCMMAALSAPSLLDDGVKYSEVASDGTSQSVRTYRRRRHPYSLRPNLLHPRSRRLPPGKRYRSIQRTGKP